MRPMPGTYALALYRGDSYSWQFKLWQDMAKTQPIDLTGATAEAEVRYTSGGADILTMTCTITTPNIIDVHLAGMAWDGFPFQASGKPSWDLQVTFANGEIVTYLAGPVTLTADITDSEPTQMVAVAARVEARRG